MLLATKPDGVEHVVTFRAGVSQVPLEVTRLTSLSANTCITFSASILNLTVCCSPSWKSG